MTIMQHKEMLAMSHSLNWEQFFYGCLSDFFSYIHHISKGMIPWKGNLSFCVYSTDKPVKYGIKAYMLSDATNSYVSKLKIYTGKNKTGPSYFLFDLTMDIMRGYFENGFSLYCDIYLMSPQLFWDLHQLGHKRC